MGGGPHTFWKRSEKLNISEDCNQAASERLITATQKQNMVQNYLFHLSRKGAQSQEQHGGIVGHDHPPPSAGLNELTDH